MKYIITEIRILATSDYKFTLHGYIVGNSEIITIVVGSEQNETIQEALDKALETIKLSRGLMKMRKGLTETSN